MSTRIAVFTDDPGWHGARLREAFEAHGCEALYVSLTQCGFDLQGAGPGLRIPGFEAALPDGAFVRGVPGGTLEQVVTCLDVLHALQALGIPVYNEARAIERSVDKAMTSFLLQRAGLAVPATWVVSDAAQAHAVWQHERLAGRELVVKPLFGSQGEGLLRLAGTDELPPPEACAGVYYLQQFVGGAGAPHDWRVFVVNGRAIACMQRRGLTWINNVAQGGVCLAAPLDRELADLAEAASQALDMDYCGVDLIRDAQGRLLVLEVNSIPAWKGLQGVCGVDIARRLVEDFLARHLLRPGIEAVGT